MVKSDTRGTREAETNKQTSKQTNKTNQNSGAVTGGYGTYGDLTTRSSRAKGHTEQEAGRGHTTTSRLGRSRQHRCCCLLRRWRRRLGSEVRGTTLATQRRPHDRQDVQRGVDVPLEQPGTAVAADQAPHLAPLSQPTCPWIPCHSKRCAISGFATVTAFRCVCFRGKVDLHMGAR